VTGSGNGGYLDSFNPKVVRWFNNTTHLDPNDTFPAFEALLLKFYKDHVKPFAQFPNPPDIELLVGVQCGDLSGLWATEKSAVRKIPFYDAVGVGCTYAKHLLDQYYNTLLDTRMTTLLAIYVISKVKSVEGCGGQTDLVILRRGLAQRLSRSWTQEVASYFAQFGWLQNHAMRLILTSPNEPEWEPDLEQVIADIREFRDGINRLWTSRKIL
jgi:hypothetical protein